MGQESRGAATSFDERRRDEQERRPSEAKAISAERSAGTERVPASGAAGGRPDPALIFWTLGSSEKLVLGEAPIPAGRAST